MKNGKHRVFSFKLDTDGYRYFYAHENNTFFEKSHLLSSKGDLVSLQDRVQKMDSVETCAQERANTKWRYAPTTNVTVFCSLLRNVSMGNLDVVIPEQFLRISDVNCFVTMFTCMDQLSWKQMQLSCSATFSTNVVMMQLTLKEC